MAGGSTAEEKHVEFGVRACDLGSFQVVSLQHHTTYGVVAYLDMQFGVVGSALERHLAPIADRTEGIDSFVPNVGVDIAGGLLKKGDANAKIIFDRSVRDVDRAAKCLELFINAIEESLSRLDDAARAVLTHDYRDSLDTVHAVSWIPRGDSLE